MTEPKLREAMRQAVDDVLDKMFFVCPLGEAETVQDESGPFVAARLGFAGARSGSMTLWVTARAAHTIAADFLGEDEASLTERQIGEVVREMANMICGAILSRVESATVFRLGEPHMLALSEDAPESVPEDANAWCGAAMLAVELPDGRLTLLMKTERPECLKIVESVS